MFSAPVIGTGPNLLGRLLEAVRGSVQAWNLHTSSRASTPIRRACCSKTAGTDHPARSTAIVFDPEGRRKVLRRRRVGG